MPRLLLTAAENAGIDIIADALVTDLYANSDGRVLDETGGVLPNLLAAGGAARGVSGSNDTGYLSGNGLLHAIVMGGIAGRTAAAMLADPG